MYMRSLIFCGVVACVLGASQANAGIVFSDNFDTEAVGLNASLTNWTITNGTIDVIGQGSPFDLLPGNGRYVDLDGTTSNAAMVTHSFLFQNGVNYQLKFDLAGSQRGDTNTLFLSVGTLLGAPINITLGSSVPFTTFTYNFVGNGTSAGILFDHQGGNNLGLLLDRVVLTEVPEPGSLLLCGLGAVSALGLRRRRVA